MTKEQRIIKTQAEQITELTKAIEDLKSKLESACKYREQYDKELKDINATFDLLGIPSRVKNSYHDLTANARLTLFLAQTNGLKVEQPKDGE